MKKSPAVLAALLAACNTAPPTLLPPPFGPDGPSPVRLFFPTGLAKTSEGVLLVANGNFNHAFEGGTVVGISRAWLDSLYRLGLDCGVADPDPRCTPQIPQDQFTGAVMIGSYAGPLILDDAGTAAYAGSRDSGTVSAVRVDPGGALHCAAGAGDDANKDCRKGLIDLKPLGVDGPYAIAAGDVIIPGTSAPRPVLYVSSIIPHIEQVSAGVVGTSSAVAALSMDSPSQVLFTLSAAQPLVANGAAVGPMVFDRARRQLYLSGCFQRFTSLGAGEPGTGPCFGVTTNYLRILNVDSMEAADPYLIDLRGDVLSTFTIQLLLGDPDPVTGVPATLWATMRSPDSLVRIELPSQPSVAPRVREAIPMPAGPGGVVRIARGSASDLLAVVTERTNSVAIVDSATGQVVASVSRLGDSPFNIQEISCPAENTGSACLAVGVFGACRIALIEVPKSQPAQTKVRALAGSCP